MNALTSGTGVADTCDVYVSDDEDENDGDEPAPVNNPAAPPAVVGCFASRGEVAAAPPPKCRAVVDFGISLKHSNPKLPGSKSHARYEVYKVAATRAQFRALGGSAADYAHNIRKSYVKLLSS